MISLLSFLLRRLAQGLVIIVLVTLAIFAVLRLVPGDPARLVLGPMASAKAVEVAAEQMGLRKPIPIQYLDWVARAIHGDFGQSYFRALNGTQVGGSHQEGDVVFQKASVLGLMMNAIPYTLLLAGFALLFTFCIGIPLGLAAGNWPHRWPDKLALYLGSLFVSIPNFWLAIVLALVVTAKLHWLPSIGYHGAAYAILPAIVVAVEMTPILMRAISTSTVVAKEQPFVALGAIRGLSSGTVFFRHVIRNSAVPILNLFGVQIAALLGSIFLVEYVFNYPGIGLLTVQAVLQRDFPVIQGVAVAITALFVLVNILVDLICSKIDPRINL